MYPIVHLTTNYIPYLLFNFSPVELNVQGRRPCTFNCQLGKVKQQIGYTFYIVNNVCCCVFTKYCLISYIKKGKYRPATTTPTSPSRSCYHSWILKRGGLDTSGRRLISAIGKTKRIAFFWTKKNILKIF